MSVHRGGPVEWGMHCSFWEFEAMLRHEMSRQDRSTFDALEFLIARGDPSERPDDPTAHAEADASARAKGWIEPSGRLNDRWYEIVNAIAHGSVYGFLRIDDPDGDETRAIVAVTRGMAVRVVVRGESVTIDEIRPDAPWPALLGCLPEAEPAEGSEVTVPTAILTEARSEAEQRQDEQVDWIAYELKLRQVPAEDAQAVGALLRRANQVTAQVTVALREADGALRRGPFAIDVHHALSGRAAVMPESPENVYTMVTPADAFMIGKALQQYVEDLWTHGEETRSAIR
jgi:hypothetical protein